MRQPSLSLANQKKVWRQWGEIIKAPTVKHSAHVHVYGCFSEKGFGKLYCFTQILNAELSCTIYKSTLLPSARTFFSKDNNNWILQEDNDPKHRSKKTHNWKVKNQIKCLSLPSQSPDLNLIENVWAILKANVNNHKPNSVKELIKIIQKEWKKFDNIFAQNLVISMKNCASLLLSNGGDHILY